MTDKEKLEKIKVLADKMYSRMAYLTSDTRAIRQAMDEYHQFVVNEYHKEEPVSEDLEEASRNYADNEEYGDDVYFAIKAAFKAGAKWKTERIMAKAIDAIAQRYDAELWLDSQNDMKEFAEGEEVKVIILKKK